MQMQQEGWQEGGRVLWEERGPMRQVGRQEEQTRDELQAGVKEPWFLGMEVVRVRVWD